MSMKDNLVQAVSPQMEAIANKMMGNIEPTIKTEINDVICLANDKSTILQVETLEQAMALLGSDSDALQKWYPDDLTMRKWLKEYPFVVFLQNKLNLPMPDMWYYGIEKPLVLEYHDKCFIVSPVKF